MKKNIGISISLILFLSGFSVAKAQDLTFAGAGARAMGIGGAFVAVADDATAIHWNPAGLTQLKKPEIAIMGAWVNDRIELEGLDIEPLNSINLDFASLILPLNAGGNNLVFGIGRVRALGFSIVFPDSDGDAVLKSSVNNTMVALAYETGEILSFGITGRLIDGKTTFKNDNDMHPDWPEGEGETKITGKTFLNYGILAKINPQIRFGAFFRQPMIFIEKGVSGVLENFEETRYEVPGSWGFGASLRIGDNFTVSSDLTRTRWEALNEDDNDLSTVRFGVEYLLGGEGLPMPVRFGMFTEPLNYKDFTNQEVKTKWLTAGLGMLGQTTQLDLAGMFGKTEETVSKDLVQTNKVIKLIGSLIIKFR